MQEEAKAFIGESLKEILPLFLECYINALSNNPSLEGQLRLQFGVVGDQEYGALVDSSQVLNQDSTVADESLSECVRESIYALRFDAELFFSTFRTNTRELTLARFKSESDR